MNVWVVRLSECPPWLTLPGITLFKGTCPVYVCVDDNIVWKALLVPYSPLPLEKSHCSTCDGRCRWRSFTRRRRRRRFSFCGISLPTLSHLTASAVKYNSRVLEYIHLTTLCRHASYLLLPLAQSHPSPSLLCFATDCLSRLTRPE